MSKQFSTSASSIKTRIKTRLIFSINSLTSVRVHLLLQQRHRFVASITQPFCALECTSIVLSFNLRIAKEQTLAVFISVNTAIIICQGGKHILQIVFSCLPLLDKQSSQNVCKMWLIGERGGGFCALVHPVFCKLLCFCLSL